MRELLSKTNAFSKSSLHIYGVGFEDIFQEKGEGIQKLESNLQLRIRF